MNLNQKLRLYNNQHYPKYHKKDTIILHHTAGYTAESAIRWWNQTPAQVGTAYAIERDGTVYEAFDPRSWAYHIGAGKLSLEKSSIGIEIVSPGPLTLKDGEFYLGSSNNKLKKDYYSGPMNFKYRGFDYYVPYTAEQVKSTVELCKYLADRFHIKFQKDPGHYDRLGQYFPGVKTQNITGLWFHSSFRQDKTDCYPDMALIKGLKGLI